MAIQRKLTSVPTRTVAGGYEAPVEGIVDYGAFQRGFQGAFVLPESPEFDEVKSYSVATFGVDQGNKLTGGEPIYKDEAGILLKSKWGKNNILTYVKGDIEKQKELEQNVGQMNEYATGKTLVFNTLGDEKQVDTNFQPPVPDENGDPIEGVTWADINKVHKKYSKSQNRSAGIKDIVRDGEIIGQKAGEFMKVKGKDIFINYQDITPEWIANNFKVNYDQSVDLEKNTPKSWKNVVEETERGKTSKDVELQPGEKGFLKDKNIFVTSGTSFIKDSWYNRAEAAAQQAGNKAFNYDQGVLGEGYDSAFRQLMGKNFEFSPEIIQGFKDKGLEITNSNQITSDLARIMPDSLKTMLLKDNFIETWKYTRATEGYTKTKNGRAKKNKYATTTSTKVRDENEGGGLTFNIGGFGVSERTKNLFDEVDKFGSSDEVYGSLFKNKQMLIDGFGKKTLNQERLTQVADSSSGREKILVFDTREVVGEDEPSFVVYDFGYSMQGDAPDVFVSTEGKIVPKDTKDAIRVSPQTVQDYMQGRIGATSGTRQADDSKEVNDVLIGRKQKFKEEKDKKENFIENYMSENNATRERAEAAYFINNN